MNAESGTRWRLLLDETIGLDRINEPVSVGLPLPRGLSLSSESCTLFDPHGNAVPVQIKPLAHWPDGSPKWLNLVYLATATANTRTAYEFQLSDANSDSVPKAPPSIAVKQDSDSISLKSGRWRIRAATGGSEFIEVEDCESRETPQSAFHVPPLEESETSRQECRD